MVRVHAVRGEFSQGGEVESEADELLKMGCDEIGAWIPTWSLGRLFENGKNAERLPELSLTIMTGCVWAGFEQRIR